MARPRKLTDEERIARSKAATAKWREKNREVLRQKARVYATIPEVAQQLSIYRKALYAAKRQALLQAGYKPSPVGRPSGQRSSDGDILFLQGKSNDYNDPTTSVRQGQRCAQCGHCGQPPAQSSASCSRTDSEHSGWESQEDHGHERSPDASR